MIRRTRAPLALVAGLGLMLAAACGGGDSGFSNGNGGNAASGGADHRRQADHAHRILR